MKMRPISKMTGAIMKVVFTDELNDYACRITGAIATMGNQ
jgi:hypothetical protein